MKNEIETEVLRSTGKMGKNEEVPPTTSQYLILENKKSTYPRFVTHLVGFFLAGGLSLIAMGGFFLNAYPPVMLDESKMLAGASKVSGLIGIKKGGRSTGIALYDTSGESLFSCFIGDCGYPNWRNDIGRNGSFWIFDGFVIQVTVDGEQRLSPRNHIENIERRRYRYGTYFSVGLIFLIVGYLINRKR